MLLLGLYQKEEYIDNLFMPVATGRVMDFLDTLKWRWGRGTVSLASVPVDPERHEARGDEPELTTRMDQLWTIHWR
jgi:DNA polymerase V